MNLNLNTITLEDQGLLTSRRKSGGGHSVRKFKAAQSRADKKERNLSALLPELSNNRYPSPSGIDKGSDLNVLNFVAASRR